MLIISFRDHKFASQTNHNELTTALRQQLEWCTTGTNVNPFEYINVFRPLVHMYNTRRMNRYLKHELDNLYSAIQDAKGTRKKSVVDLALASYLTENPSASSINADFQDFAMAQIKLFVFAGHDTTSSGVVFTYHLLSQHPEVLREVRAEHDRVFGTNVGNVASLLSSQPSLLSQLTYTLAMIKESLRIYPTVAALRIGQPEFFISTVDGQTLPTENCVIWGDHYGTQHNPQSWTRPEEFLPERFLVPEGNELYPPKNGWRPFERGPRNCIGQELALTEIKVVLALTIREFEFKNDYGSLDAKKQRPQNWHVNGQRAYMMRRGGGHPADHYPCKVSFVQASKEKTFGQHDS